MRHMVTAAEAIAGYVRRGREAFDTDSAIREAIVYQMVILGEAAKAVVVADGTIPHEIADVEWSLLARMRDKITHQYWAVDKEIVWATATQDIPAILATLQATIGQG